MFMSQNQHMHEKQKNTNKKRRNSTFKAVLHWMSVYKHSVVNIYGNRSIKCPNHLHLSLIIRIAKSWVKI